MRQIFSMALILALAGLTSGCKICHGLGWKHSCLGGLCGHGGCKDGSCHDGACHDGGCAHGDCAAGCAPQGPLHLGHDGPPQRAGLFSQFPVSGPGTLGLDHGGGGGGGGGFADRRAARAAQNFGPAPGPSAGNVSYPYYTTRGPRDFLAPNPRGIGP